MTVGLQRGTVILLPYSSVWAKDFIKEKRVLTAIFGNAAQAIEHVGSTAVPNLSAKPIIDIEVGLKDFSQWRQFVKPLEVVDYLFMPDRIRDDEVFLPKGPEAKRTHYLHITQFDSREWRVVLRFRNELRADSRLREKYEKLKEYLATEFPNDRKAYSAGKQAFIEEVIANG